MVELVLQMQYSTDSPQRIVSAVFIYAPEVAWPLAPLLHRGIGHLAANILVCFVAMPAEARLKRLEYLGLVVAAGYLPVYLDGVKLAIFGTEPHVAAYGTSAFAFGLVGVEATSLVIESKKPTARGWLVVALAGAAIVVIVGDLVTAAPDPGAVNVGHLSGLLAGCSIGYVTASNE